MKFGLYPEKNVRTSLIIKSAANFRSPFSSATVGPYAKFLSIPRVNDLL